jgi:hypothetical protein
LESKKTWSGQSQGGQKNSWKSKYIYFRPSKNFVKMTGLSENYGYIFEVISCKKMNQSVKYVIDILTI